MEKHNRLRILSYAIICYMLLALGWWSYLLYQQNTETYETKVELLKISKAGEGEEKVDIAEFRTDADYLILRENYRRQKRMIILEAAVLALSMLTGVWFINSGYQRQADAARQSRNFLLSITHEFKSPIASIKLILQTFTSRDLKMAQIKRFSGNALKETERLSGLVSNLLLAARMETAIDTRPEELDLFPLVDGMRESLISKTPKAKIELDVDENVIIFADKTGITSVFLNLMENAIKYSDGDPVIKVRHVEEGGYDIITVADNGIGIPAKLREVVFERFYRIGNEDTRKTKGTGLGLYIVKQIVESHKGKIKVAPNQPKGTVFTIKIPIGI